VSGARKKGPLICKHGPQSRRHSTEMSAGVLLLDPSSNTTTNGI